MLIYTKVYCIYHTWIIFSIYFNRKKTYKISKSCEYRDSINFVIKNKSHGDAWRRLCSFPAMQEGGCIILLVISCMLSRSILKDIDKLKKKKHRAKRNKIVKEKMV